MSFYPLGLTDVPTRDLRRALLHLHRGELDCPVTIISLTRIGLQHRVELLLPHLRGLDEVAVRAVLVAVLAERQTPRPPDPPPEPEEPDSGF